MEMTDKPDDKIWRDPLALAMISAWCGVTPDQAPKNFGWHTCQSTADAWKRVADAARAHIEQENRGAPSAPST